MSEKNKTLAWRLVSLGFALVASDFLYQFFTHENWSLALDRSYFQCVALIIAYFSIREKPAFEG